jgi:branched-chain amino acid transport system permease protein
LDVPTGSVAAVIGPNGSGKTTLLNVVSGLVTPDSVRIEFLGDDITNVSPDGRARLGLARTFQTPLLFDQMSCLDNVLVAIDRVEPKDSAGALLRLPRWRKAEHSKIERATEILDALGLGAKADAPARSLTPGERRLLELSRVIGLGPRLVLMDEPAAGLTEPEIEILEQLIRELVGQGVAVVLVEHHVDVVMRLADQVTALDFGEVIAHGLPDAVRRDPAVVGAYFGDQDAELADPPLSGAVGPGGEDGDD